MAHIKKEIWKKKAVNNGHFAPGQPQPDPRKALEGRWHQKVNQPPVSDSPGLWTAPHVKGGGHNFWGKAAQICSEKFSKEGAAGSQNGRNSQQLWDRCPWWRGSGWAGPPIHCLGTSADRVGRTGVASSVLGSVHPCYRSPSLQSREVCMAIALGGAGRIKCLDGFLAWPRSS